MIVIGSKEQVHHIQDVLRLKISDNVDIFDELQNLYRCVVVKSGKEVHLRVKDKTTSSGQKAKIKITVACALPKKSRIDDIIDKLTQLGVDKIIPLETERVVVRIENERAHARLARWQKIIQNAAQQSQRSTIPVVTAVKKMKEVLSAAREYGLKLIPTLVVPGIPLKEALRHLTPDNIIVLIGPEGDFTPEEVSQAKDAGFIPVSLGDLVLRVETAALATVSFLLLNQDRDL